MALPGGNGRLPDDVLRGGSIRYDNGNQTPITLPVGSPTKLTCDGSTIVESLPSGITSLWDTVNSQCNFSELSLYDKVDFRVDGVLTTLTFNDGFVLSLVVGIGTSNETTFNIASGVSLFAGSSPISRTSFIVMEEQDWIDSPAEIRATAIDSAAEAYLTDIEFTPVLKGE